MQKRYSLIFILLFCFSLTEITAQTVKTNSKGETIVFYPDGSWRYYDENDSEDQLLLQRQLERDGMATTKTNPDTATAGTGDVEYATEEEVEEKKEDFDRADAQSRQRAIDLSEKERRNERKALANEMELKRSYEQLKIKYKVLKSSKTSDNYTIAHSKLKRNQAKIRYKLAIKQRKQATKRAKSYERIVNLPTEQRNKELDKMKQENAYVSTIPDIENELQKFEDTTPEPLENTAAKETGSTVSIDTESIPEAKPVVNSKGNPLTEKEERKKAASYKLLSAKDNVMINPPSPDCDITFDGIDEFSGKKRKDLAPKLFFTFTPQQLREHYKGKERIETHAYLSNIQGGARFLSLKIIVNDAKAQRTYGMIEKGSVLNIKMIDGTNISLTNNKTDQGILRNEQVVYSVQYRIATNQQKFLQDLEIDKLRIVWSTGYEDYEIYETDFLIHQFACLTGK